MKFYVATGGVGQGLESYCSLKFHTSFMLRDYYLCWNFCACMKFGVAAGAGEWGWDGNADWNSRICHATRLMSSLELLHIHET